MEEELSLARACPEGLSSAKDWKSGIHGAPGFRVLGWKSGDSSPRQANEKNGSLLPQAPTEPKVKLDQIPHFAKNAKDGLPAKKQGEQW